jgi:two-component system chemotaxis response regulator CheV
VGGYALGVNVAKVREVLPAQKITHLPKAHESVVGCFTLRDHVVPCVSLHQHLGEATTNNADEVTIILTEFNQYQTAFVVDSVERIHRVNWGQVLAAPSTINTSETPVTAVTTIENRLILMLDFEMIADQVCEQANRTPAIANPQGLPREELRILLAEDSATVRQAVAETLNGSGYTNLKIFENGEETWNWLQARLDETGDVRQFADLLISDVEMPRIDGLHLTKNIKDHPELKKIYVLLYSSIVTVDNRKKGAAVNADGMITKPELSKVVDLADELLTNRLEGHEGFASTIVEPPTSPDTPADAVAPADRVVAESESQVASPDVAVQPEVDAAKETSVEPVTADQSTSNDAAVDASEVVDDSAATSSAAGGVATTSQDRFPDPPPSAINNNSLWLTFRHEIAGIVDQLEGLRALSADEVPSDGLVNDTFRFLHSIKSASMVVPVDEVTRLTHIVEDVLDLLRHGQTAWPQEEFAKYVDWLRELVNPANDEHEVQTVLANGRGLEKAFAVKAQS